MSIKKDLLSKPLEDFWLLNTDSSPLFRPHSPTLPQRRYVYKSNNQVKGNKPVEVGYELSCVGLSCRRPLYGCGDAPWNPPLSMRLIPFDQNRNSFTARQVNELINNEELPFGRELTVNVLDSNYSSPEYIAQTYAQDNLVNIIRLARNRKVWKKLSRREQLQRRSNNADNRGADAVYGQVYKLSEADQWDLPCDRQNRFSVKLANGKCCQVEVDIWEDMMLRSKRGHNMKDKSCCLARIRMVDAQTREPIFKTDMWLSLWGKKSKQLSGEQIYWAYRNRYDIEHFFRFGKQRLLLDKSQTPDQDHLHNWLQVVNLAYWLLWAARQEADYECPKWQKYDKHLAMRRENGLGPSPSQVQRQLAGIILSFEQDPFLPKMQIKGKGRKKGQTLPKRKRYPVRKKKKKT